MFNHCYNFDIAKKVNKNFSVIDFGLICDMIFTQCLCSHSCYISPCPSKIIIIIQIINALLVRGTHNRTKIYFVANLDTINKLIEIAINWDFKIALEIKAIETFNK